MAAVRRGAADDDGSNYILPEYNITEIQIVSDSFAVLQWIEGVYRIRNLKVYTDIHWVIGCIRQENADIPVRLQWVKSHTGVYGTDSADFLAKAGMQDLWDETVKWYDPDLWKWYNIRAVLNLSRHFYCDEMETRLVDKLRTSVHRTRNWLGCGGVISGSLRKIVFFHTYFAVIDGTNITKRSFPILVGTPFVFSWVYIRAISILMLIWLNVWRLFPMTSASVVLRGRTLITLLLTVPIPTSTVCGPTFDFFHTFLYFPVSHIGNCRMKRCMRKCNLQPIAKRNWPKLCLQKIKT